MIILIDNYDSFTFNLYQLLAAGHDEVKVIRNDKCSVEDIAALNPAGIVISPGPGRPEKAGICVELIQKLGQTVPFLGVCLGHQALAVAFGCTVSLAAQPVHGKPEYIFHQRQGLYQGLPLPFQAARYHSLIVDKASLSDDFVVDAENADGEVMGMRHRQLPLFGVQFHPESILSPEGANLINNFTTLVCSDVSAQSLS